LAIAFGPWCCLIRGVNPSSVSLIILIESGLIMCDRDELKATAWDLKAIWPQEFDAIIVPFLEATFVFFPVADKSTTIFHNIVSFMAIDIHAISHLPIPPAKSS